MASWLSDAWVLESQQMLATLCPPGGEPTGMVAVEVTGPDGGWYWREWRSGVPVDGGTGKPAGAADLTLTVGATDAHAFWAEGWSPSVAFMRGELKMAGRMELLLPLLKQTAQPRGSRSVTDPAVG